MFSLKKREMREDLRAICNYLVSEYKEDGARLFLEVQGGRTGDNRRMLQHEIFQSGIKKNFFTITVVRHWHRLPRESEESPSLEIQKYGCTRPQKT